MASKIYNASDLLAAIQKDGFDKVIQLLWASPAAFPNCTYINMHIYGKPGKIRVLNERIAKGVQPLSETKAAAIAATVNTARKGKNPIDVKAFIRQGVKGTFTITAYKKNPAVEADGVTIVADAELGDVSVYFELMEIIWENVAVTVSAAIQRGEQFVAALKAAPTSTVGALRAAVGSAARNDIVIFEDKKADIRAAVGKTGAADFLKELAAWALFVPNTKLCPLVQTEFSEKSPLAGQLLPNPTTRPCIQFDDKVPTLPLGSKFGKPIGIFDLGKATFGPDGKPVSVPAATINGEPITGHNVDEFIVRGSTVDFVCALDPVFSKSGFSIPSNITALYLSQPAPYEESDPYAEMYGGGGAAPAAAAHAPRHDDGAGEGVANLDLDDLIGSD
jgi:hypothetical protein